ncbi:Membrane associated serine protease, rhomboid family [Alteromonadaceae bacterium Bs31]|nr:Membrane associated serine protease, rhomboid family [Alteromonadaceae bacterium Bs31]
MYFLPERVSGFELAKEIMVLDSWNLVGVFGYMFLHADFVHLAGNMYLLWVFGNAMCSKITGYAYIPLFILFGVVAAGFHNLIDARPAVGASGALFGVVGFYFALYPTNKISCLWFMYSRAGTFEISAHLLVGFWVVQDIAGLFGAPSPIAHMAHISGFLVGLVVGYWLLITGRIAMYDYDLKTLPDLIQ